MIAYCRQPYRAADKGRSEDDGEGFFQPNPWEQLRHERTYWQERVAAYESGRFMRTMKWLNRTADRFRTKSQTTSEQ